MNGKEKIEVLWVIKVFHVLNVMVLHSMSHGLRKSLSCKFVAWKIGVNFKTEITEEHWPHFNIKV